MADLKNAKLLGGIGAILTLVGVGFIGFILKLLAVKNIAEATGRGEIFSKYLWAAILAIIADLVLVSAFIGSMGTLTESPEEVIGMIGLGGLVAIVLLIAGMWLMKQSYDLIAEETGVGTFRTVAKLYIIGAILLIVIVGAFLILVAAILEIVAFFSLPDSIEQDSEPLPVQEGVY